MKILFIIPRNKNLFGDDPKNDSVASHPNVGVAYLTSYLKKNNYEVEIFDESVEGWHQNQLTYFLKINKFDIIGITTFSYCYKFIHEIINKIKPIVNCPIVIGGPHVSAVKNKSLEQFNVDFAIKGEGEQTLVELLQTLEQKKEKFCEIKGLIWKNNNQIIENDNRPPLSDLDSLPWPDFEAFKLDKYSYSQNKTMPIISSRGCPYSCNYCSVRLTMGQNFRPRSAENFIRELVYWYKKDYKNFELNDDCFSLDLERAKKICQLIIENNLNITWQLYNGIRVDRVDEDLLILMKKSGCIFISYGCESGNQNIINNIGKNIQLEQVKKAVSLTNKIGIKNSVNFIIGHPGETYQTAIDTLNFAKKIPADFVNMYNLIPYPGTKLFDWIEKNGHWLHPQEYILSEIGSRDLEPAFETLEFPKKQRIKIFKKAFALFEYRILIFRLGKVVGRIVYFLTRFKFLMKIGRHLALENKHINKLYILLSKKSRKNI